MRGRAEAVRSYSTAHAWTSHRLRHLLVQRLFQFQQLVLAFDKGILYSTHLQCLMFTF